MNPGPIEEVGQTARTLIDVLKEQPLSLALVVMNLALLGMLWWTTNKQVELRSHDLALYFQQQKEQANLLARCVVPKP